LGPRQIAVAEFVCKGYWNADIATALKLSERTVKAYVSDLLLFYNAANRTELAGLYSMAKGRHFNVTENDQ